MDDKIVCVLSHLRYDMRRTGADDDAGMERGVNSDSLCIRVAVMMKCIDCDTLSDVVFFHPA